MPNLFNVVGSEKELARAELRRRAALGAIETGMTIGSGALAEPAAGLAGLFAAASGGGADVAANAVRKTREALTYSPRTIEGQSNLQGASQILSPIGETFESASRASGNFIYDKTESEFLAAAGYSIPTIAAEILGARGLSRPAKMGRSIEFQGLNGPLRERGAVSGLAPERQREIYATSQNYIDPDIVDAKIRDGDFEAQVSPLMRVHGVNMRVVLDGHHSLAAAKRAGVEPKFTELTASEHDAIGLPPEEMLDAVWMGSDWRDALTDDFIW